MLPRYDEYPLRRDFCPPLMEHWATLEPYGSSGVLVVTGAYHGRWRRPHGAFAVTPGLAALAVRSPRGLLIDPVKSFGFGEPGRPITAEHLVKEEK